MSTVISCRWDWCRSSFTSIDALDTHVKHDHIWPMKPMRKADIVLMRRMDLQSLHSSPNTDPSIIPTGFIAGMSRSKTPPPTSTPKTYESPGNEVLPASPALEGLMRQNGHSGLSAAVEMFERAHGHKLYQRLRLPSHQRSPTHRPLSESSGSSQEVVEQQLTQEDDVASQPQPLLPSELQIDNELLDGELRWPTDDESDVVATEGIQNSEQPVSKQGSSPDSARGRNFRCGSLNVLLGTNSQSASSPHASQGSHSQIQPIVLQTQAPYFSQATGWSQSQ